MARAPIPRVFKAGDSDANTGTTFISRTIARLKTLGYLTDPRDMSVMSAGDVGVTPGGSQDIRQARDKYHPERYQQDIREMVECGM